MARGSTLPAWVNGGPPGTPAGATNMLLVNAAIEAAYAAAIIVAASDSPTAWQEHARYQCDGTADEVQINAAIAAAAALESAGDLSQNASGDCFVLLAPGNYSTDAPVDLYGRVHLQAMSRGSVMVKPSSSHSAVGSATSGVVTLSDPSGSPYDHLALINITIHGLSRDLNGIYSVYAQTDSSKDDENTGGTPDHHNIIRDCTVVSCGRSGVYIDYAQASTAWRLENVKVFGCGDTLSTSAGIYFQGLDGNLTNCDVGSQGTGSGTTNYGFRVAGSDCAITGCIAWLTKGTGFYVTGSNHKFATCEAHHSQQDGWEITGNRNIFVACQSYNNDRYGWQLSANSVHIVACSSSYYSDSYGYTQSHGIYLSQTNPSGHNVEMTTYGSSLTPIAGASTNAALAVRKPNHYRIHHNGDNVDGSAGTVEEIEYRFGCRYAWGSGSPEGVVTATIGSQYTDYAGGSGTVLYVKESGTGDTGWSTVA